MVEHVKGMTKSHRLERRSLLLVALPVLLGCGRWRPNTPIELSVRKESTTFPRLLNAVRTHGYAVLEQDPSAGYLRVTAKTTSSVETDNGMVPAPPSWFGIQLRGNKLVLRASGHLVRDNDTVRRSGLDDEMRQLADQLASELGS